MIKQYLDTANSILEKLIKLTESDINDIQNAKHENVAKSVEEKNKLIAEFQLAKKQLDDELIRLNNSNPKGFIELLDDEDKTKLAELKQNLQTLHSKNKEYAKFVLIVKDFFDGLLNTMFENGNGMNNAYGDKKTELESLFKINV
ncbi:flagellar export chaperone FlgN [Campylobacter sp. US33a]|uniref:Flagellar export chaperone FlgN n=1 Tax=Campylobacter sp. CCS1377 TaxID=3158229 RepID=A0AAU7E7C9_9BACT|nr:flagellar export chaperone FlgN [Campylobacter sp. US33a]TEY03956.1 flagellar protein FlgN [Campylobacter sp. US33a]